MKDQQTLAMATLEGGCFCGEVRYCATGEPSGITHCHCTICRRTSAAAFVTWLSVPRATFRVTRGEPHRFRSSGDGTRAFCPSCGTPLLCELDAYPEEVDVTVCSLDDPGPWRAVDHIHTANELPWMHDLAALPRHRGGHGGPN